MFEYIYLSIYLDFATYEGRTFLIVVDYFSRWLEILHMTSTTSASTIDRLRGLFGRFGIPEILRSDGGPQFSSQAFADFSKTYGFKHIMSSPHNPRSNGAVERAVQTAKRIIQQPDPTLALLAYRNTPLEVTGHSPARLLMGRNLRTRLPIHPVHMKPQWPDFIELQHHHDLQKLRQKEGYDKRHGAALLDPPSVGDDVRVRHDGEKHWNGPVRVIGPAAQPNSFIIPSATTQTPVVRNRRFILPIPPDSRPSPDAALPPVTRPASWNIAAPQPSRSSPLSASPQSAPSSSPQSPPASSQAPEEPEELLPAAEPPPPPAQPAQRTGTAPPPAAPPAGATAAPGELPRFTRSGRRVKPTKRADYHYY